MIEKKEIYMNYKRQNKWLGIIDYKTLTIVIAYSLFILYLLINLKLSFKISVYVFSILIIPIIALMFVSSKNGSAIEILVVIIKYMLNKKIFVDTRYLDKNKMYKYINYYNKKM